MAGKSDEGSKDSNLGNREHFDSFDRLQKVDQQNLNVDELKAEDKDSDSEELLATKDKTHYETNKEETGNVKITTINFDLDTHKRETTDINTIDESSKSTYFQQSKNAIVPNTPLDNNLNLNNTTQGAEQTFNIRAAEAKISGTSDRQEELLPPPPQPPTDSGAAQSTTITETSRKVITILPIRKNEQTM